MSDTLIKFRVGWVVALTALLGFALMKVMEIAPIGVDDANILFVYSKHFAAGEGLVYNIGGERVEGYSSTLWMLLTAIGYLFTDFPYPLFLMLNLLLVGGVLGYALHFVEEHFGDSHTSKWLLFSAAGWLFLLWTIANPSFYLWTVASLLETGLWACLLIAAAVFMLKTVAAGEFDLRAARIFAFLNAMMVLTRPEGFAWAGVFCAALLLVVRAYQADDRQAHKRWFAVVLTTVLAFGALVMFRLAYFGYPWPNTYYAKVTPDKLYNLGFGIDYVLAFARAHPLVIPLAALASFGFVRHIPAVIGALLGRAGSLSQRHCGEFLLGGVIVTGIALPILMGGDIFGAFRFYQPIWPLLILTVFYCPRPAFWSIPNSVVVTATVAVTAVVLFTFANHVRWPGVRNDRAHVRHQFELSERLTATGDYLQRLYGDYSRGLPVLGVSAAGGSKINYPGDVVDMMGLNFTPMAHHAGDKKGIRGHAAFDKGVFWQYAPDLLEPNLCPRNRPPVNLAANPDGWLYRIYRGLPADADFMSTYTFVALEVPGTTDRVCTYASNDWLAAMRADGSFAIEVVR